MPHIAFIALLGSTGSVRLSDPESESTSDSSAAEGKTSLTRTSVNIAKLCMGTGTLALPFAACQGGMIFNAVGMALVTAWNIYSVDRLLRCLEYIEEEKVHSMFKHSSPERLDGEVSENEGTNTLSLISKEAFGNTGVMIVDTCLLILMIAIIIAYQGKFLF